MFARLNPLRRPRRYLRLAAGLMVGYAAWLLLVPITVDYKDTGDQVTVEGTLYSWWSNHNTITGIGLDDPASDELAAYVLLDCGNSFTTGDHEHDHEPAGPESCSSVEVPRRVIGIGLAVLGVAGLLAAGKVPAERLTRADRAEERRLTDGLEGNA